MSEMTMEELLDWHSADPADLWKSADEMARRLRALSEFVHDAERMNMPVPTTPLRMILEGRKP
jgi:hypothetical protein